MRFLTAAAAKVIKWLSEMAATASPRSRSLRRRVGLWTKPVGGTAGRSRVWKVEPKFDQQIFASPFQSDHP